MSLNHLEEKYFKSESLRADAIKKLTSEKDNDLKKIENFRVEHKQSFKIYQDQVAQRISKIEARHRSNWRDSTPSRQLNLKSIEDPFAKPEVQVANPENQFFLKNSLSNRSVVEIGQDLTLADFFM